MPQDKESGEKGNEYGLETARKVASAIGAEMLGSASNEAIYRGKNVVIKCARVTTSSIGVTFKMQKSVSDVIAALEQPDGKYKIFALDIKVFRSKQKQSQSKPDAGHKVGQVSKSVFTNQGALLSIIII